MKRFALALVVLAATVCFSQTTTPNLGLTKPAVGDVGWGPVLNNNADIIDTQLGELPSLVLNLKKRRFAYFQASGSSSNTTFGDGLTNNCSVQIQAGTTSSEPSVTCSTTNTAAYLGWYSDGTQWITGHNLKAWWQISIADVSNARIYTGLNDTGGVPTMSSGNNRVGFKYDPSVSTRLKCVSGNSTGTEEVDSGSNFTAANHTLEIRDTSAADGKFHFYWNGAEVCTSGFTKWPDNSAPLRWKLGIQSVEGSSKTVSLYQMLMTQDRWF